MCRNLCAVIAAILLSLQSASAQDADIGEMAPDFVLLDLAGAEVALSDSRGRVVLLNFFGYS
ncbi:MAG: hypothetical protein ACI906_002404 [Candidatus Latescibacterota bacterium]|jgi:hypothetical protein